MAVRDIEPALAMTGRLQDLLDRASRIKESTAIDPPLQVSELSSEGEMILGPAVGDAELHKAIVDGAARNLFYDVLVFTTTLRFHAPLSASGIYFDSRPSIC
jgi:THO complex subunit 1